MPVRLLVLLLVALPACLDLSLPASRAELPGTISATVFVQRSGMSELVPAAGAVLSMADTGLSATADAEGNVRLEGVERAAGLLRLGWDADHDGVDDNARSWDLQLIGAGRGHDVNLGVVVLGRLASVFGVVRRGERARDTGHGGIQVFVSASPAATVTADDGSFTLAGLPEGNVPVTAFAPGYESITSRLTLGAGQSQRLADLDLAPSSDTRTGTLEGRVFDGALPLGEVLVVAGGSGVTSGADGAWRLDALPAGPTSVFFRKSGFTPRALENLLVRAGATTVVDVVMRPGDDDAGVAPQSDAGTVSSAGPVRIIGESASSGFVVDGGVSIPAPLLAVPGDIVLLMLLRPNVLDPIADGTGGWRSEADRTLLSSSVDAALLTRRVAADDALHPERYWFPAAARVTWSLLVLRGADRVALIRSRDAPVPATFEALTASPGELVLELFTSPVAQACQGPGLRQLDTNMSVASFVVPANGVVGPLTVQCSMTGTFGRLDQLRVFAKP